MPTTDFSALSTARKKAIRAEMLRRWKQKLRKKGAAKAAGGDPKKTSGTHKGKKYGTGSLKGWTTPTGQRLTADEITYAKTVRSAQKKSGKIGGKSRKAIAKKARKTGAKSAPLKTAMSMKQKSKGGTVSYGSHKAVAGKKGGGAARKAAKAWRVKHMAAAGTGKDKASRDKRKKIADRFKHMIGKK